ncbi:hypothetical protein DSO57_1017635 [Entomophthora muscae]|uniref:Uncharacterized protein n=1 Tax=Entomophthora muscae TaxID=34485 RepID=A0ACC2RVY3_9FUNG|nr:hypothetical protein DSO57_1017635 [Entomophthora muscae]
MERVSQLIANFPDPSRYGGQTFPAFHEATDLSDWHNASIIAKKYTEILHRAAIFLN